MEKKQYVFNDFLAQVNKENKEFVKKTHEMLEKDNYKAKIEDKASGLFISYSDPQRKRALLNFLFRKKGLLVRIYADNHSKYADFINTLPKSMENEIAKATICKRLIDPNECNQKCSMGYDFYIGKKRYQKCKYSCFQFTVNSESIPVLLDFIGNELTENKI